MRFFADPIGRMQALRRDFGELAAVADRSPALICAFGPELNRQVLSSGAVFQNDSRLPLRAPEGSALAKFNTSLIFANGETHRKYRRLLMPAFSKARLEAYAPDMIAMAELSLSSWPVGETLDIVPLLHELTTNVVLRCIFGLDPRGGAELAATEASILAALNSPLTMLLPLPIPGTPYRSLRRNTEHMRRYLLALIAQKRELADSQRDALSLMIAAHDEDGSRLSDDELLGNVHTLLVAGHDTSAHTLVWTLFLLERHPKVLAALLAELDAELDGAPPRIDQLERLVVLDRVIKESMRLLPVTPMLFLRVLAEQAELGGVSLPRQTNVVLSPYLTHRDPELYEQPRRFWPDRWERLQPSAHQYLPFGAGPRTCLGIGFASQLLRLVLPMILQRYALMTAEGARIDRQVRGIVTAPKHGMPMRIAKPGHQLRRGGEVRGDIHEMVEGC
ncbi:MAG: cytochrome P450 [Enhygromyxa sp.]